MAITDDDSEAVRRQIEGWRRAVENRDVDRIMSFYGSDDDFLGFDFVPPFMLPSIAAFRTQWTETLAALDGDPVFELKDIRVHCSGTLAVAYGLSHFKGSMHGSPVDVWTRQTNAFRNVGGQWLLIHEHVSVPVDMRSAKGVLDYVP